METLFWTAITIVIYTYIGYGTIAYLLSKLKQRKPVLAQADEDLPTITMVVAAHNEMACLPVKVENCKQLDYPQHKMKLLFVTDGSTDGSEEWLAKQDGLQVMHQPGRAGKTAALNRAMQHVDSELTVFTDANAMLNPAALRLLASHYQDATVGAVSGEKVVQSQAEGSAQASEGLYWRYESFLKRCDARLYSLVGAAGELISFRTALYETINPEVILDDFDLSMSICRKGYRVAYEPAAKAVEMASSNVAQEWKRKVRIASGGTQAILSFADLLNPFKNLTLAFSFFSHRVLRWSLAPLSLVLALLANVYLIEQDSLYLMSLGLQALFYGLAAAGWWLNKLGKRNKLLYIPYYFSMMNLAVLAGIYRYFRGQSSAIWERSEREVTLA